MRELITATHENIDTKEFLRIGKGEYAECYLNGKWVECGKLKNTTLPKIEILSSCFKYRRIFKTGLNRDLCNLRLLFIGSSYRIK